MKRNKYFVHAFIITAITFASSFDLPLQQKSETNYTVNLTSTSDGLIYFATREVKNKTTDLPTTFDSNIHGENLTINYEKYHRHTGESLIMNNENSRHTQGSVVTNEEKNYDHTEESLATNDENYFGHTGESLITNDEKSYGHTQESFATNDENDHGHTGENLITNDEKSYDHTGESLITNDDKSYDHTGESLITNDDKSYDHTGESLITNDDKSYDHTGESLITNDDKSYGHTEQSEATHEEKFYGHTERSLATNDEKKYFRTEESLKTNYEKVDKTNADQYESSTDYGREGETGTIKIFYSEETPEPISIKREITYETCQKYQNGEEIDIDSMVDIWQTVYYKMPEDIPIDCFIMIIKKIFPNYRNKLMHVYGDFNQTVDWSECQLEILTTTYTFDNRRHFLQSIEETDGVFENIIIEPDEFGQDRLVTEPPYQWRFMGDHLMMRDCESDGIVVYMKVPVKLKINDLRQALRSFGADDIDEEGLCEDPKFTENIEKSYVFENDNSNYDVLTNEKNIIGYF